MAHHTKFRRVCRSSIEFPESWSSEYFVSKSFEALIMFFHFCGFKVSLLIFILRSSTRKKKGVERRVGGVAECARNEPSSKDIE